MFDAAFYIFEFYHLDNLPVYIHVLPGFGNYIDAIEKGSFVRTTCSRRAFMVVLCPSSIVSNVFKHILLPNLLANLDQTWQGLSFGGTLQKLIAEFDSINNSNSHGNQVDF